MKGNRREGEERKQERGHEMEDGGQRDEEM
jgi:hypothetical protein